MITVDIRNLTTSPPDKKFVKKIVRETLRYMEIKGTISVGIAFVGRVRIRELNNKYNKKNAATDVLSFGSDEQFVVPKDTGEYLGEIVVCPAVVKEQSAKSHTIFAKEFAHVLIHGILHLLGWEHEKSEKKAKEMHAKEEEIMDMLGV